MSLQCVCGFDKERTRHDKPTEESREADLVLGLGALDRRSTSALTLSACLSPILRTAKRASPHPLLPHTSVTTISEKSSCSLPSSLPDIRWIASEEKVPSDNTGFGSMHGTGGKFDFEGWGLLAGRTCAE